MLGLTTLKEKLSSLFEAISTPLAGNVALQHLLALPFVILSCHLFGFIIVWGSMLILFAWYLVRRTSIQKECSQKELSMDLINKQEYSIERIEWVNMFLRKYWDTCLPHKNRIIQDILQKAMNANKPSFMYSVSVMQLDIGSNAPVFECLSTNSCLPSNKMQLDVVVHYHADQDARLVVKIEPYFPRVTIPVEIQDIRIRARVRLEIDLCSLNPHSSTISTSILGTPAIDYSLRSLGGSDLSVIPGVFEFFQNFMHKAIEGWILWPHTVTYSLSGTPIEHDAPICDICIVIAHENAVIPEGYQLLSRTITGKFPADLNRGSTATEMYICYKRLPADCVHDPSAYQWEPSARMEEEVLSKGGEKKEPKHVQITLPAGKDKFSDKFLSLKKKSKKKTSVDYGDGQDSAGLDIKSSKHKRKNSYDERLYGGLEDDSVEDSNSKDEKDSKDSKESSKEKDGKEKDGKDSKEKDKPKPRNRSASKLERRDAAAVTSASTPSVSVGSAAVAQFIAGPSQGTAGPAGEKGGERERAGTATGELPHALPLYRPDELGGGGLSLSSSGSSERSSLHERLPITGLCVIFTDKNESPPPEFQVILRTTEGADANLNLGGPGHESYLCYTKAPIGPPIVDIGVFNKTEEREISKCFNAIELSPTGYRANLNKGKPDADELYLCYKGGTHSLFGFIPAKGQSGLLRVRLVAGRKLRTMDTGGICSPFCELSITGGLHDKEKNKKHRSKIMDKTQNPKWNEVFVFRDIHPSDTLNVHVYDTEKTTDKIDKRLIGCLKFPLDTLIFGVEVEAWYELQMVTHGQILLSITALNFGLRESAQRGMPLPQFDVGKGGKKVRRFKVVAESALVLRSEYGQGEANHVVSLRDALATLAEEDLAASGGSGGDGAGESSAVSFPFKDVVDDLVHRMNRSDETKEEEGLAHLDYTEKKGYLDKKPAKMTKKHKAFYQRRWFHLKEGKLLYYKSQKDKVPINVFDLRGAEVAWEGDTITVKSMEKRMILVSPENELEEWVRAIRHNAMLATQLETDFVEQPSKDDGQHSD